jgi:cathepsin F
MSSVSNALFDEFQKWTSIYNRVFANSELRDKSFSAWQQNFQHVEYINSLNLSWTASIYTPYADMTTEEFKNKILLRPFDVTVSYPQFSEVKVSPTSRYGNLNNDGFDWRDYGAVTPVQDQGTVGTCWAFSTIGNIEGVWFLNNHTLTKLSEEYIVDCDGTHDESHADCGVFGGWPYLAYDFVIKSGGVPTEDAYPYCSGTGDCYPCMQGPISLCGPPPLYCDKTIEQNKCPTQYQGTININNDS